jgi:hypothetical protein
VGVLCVWGGAYRVVLVYVWLNIERVLNDVEMKMKVLKRGMDMQMKRLSERMLSVCVADEAA